MFFFNNLFFFLIFISRAYTHIGFYLLPYVYTRKCKYVCVRIAIYVFSFIQEKKREEHNVQPNNKNNNNEIILQSI
jgi:hypothetical protein